MEGLDNNMDFPANERLQIEDIRVLEHEQLEEEEANSDESDGDRRGDGGSGYDGIFTFDTSLASMHSYLGDVDDIRNRLCILDGGAIVTLPIFYLEGIVLFPDMTLPLRIVQPRFLAAVERAMHQQIAPNTIGVVHVSKLPHNNSLQCALVGTTAEIRQFRRLGDGSMNVVTRGQQRFHLLRKWVDADGTPCAMVQIIQEDTPLNIPKEAFGSLASVPNLQSGKAPRTKPSNNFEDGRLEIESEEEGVYFERSDSDNEELPLRGQRRTSVVETDVYPGIRDEESSGSDDDIVTWWGRRQALRNTSRNIIQARRLPRRLQTQSTAPGSQSVMDDGNTSEVARNNYLNDKGWGNASKAWATDFSKWKHRAQCSAWPYWVYRMFDADSLARRVSDMWRQMFEKPCLDALMKKPLELSFHIASKIAVPDSTKQELLESTCTVYRLQKEIQLLECIDDIRCKGCMTVIAKRRDILVMSTDCPVGAYVNPHGFVHDTLTLYKARWLALRGRAETEHSWFPGYAWTIAICSNCDSHMGWLFTAVKEGLRPKSFWGVRRAQLADPTH